MHARRKRKLNRRPEHLVQRSQLGPIRRILRSRTDSTIRSEPRPNLLLRDPYKTKRKEANRRKR